VKSKDKFKSKLVQLIEDLKDKGKFVNFTRLDDAGENTSIERAYKEKYSGIKFEFSDPRALHRNGKDERKFQILYERIRSRLNDSGIKEEMRRGFRAEYASSTTFYANILVNCESGKPPHESMFGVGVEQFENIW
jgi:ubiquinone/menaquinone biosynthesis C-methylase UbiE